MKPLLLLDIDGVLSPLGKIDTDECIIQGNGWTTWYIPYDTVALLHRLKDKVTFVCSSTWERDAASLFRTIFIPVEDYVIFPPTMPEEWSKGRGYQDYIADAPQPLVILDDEFTEDFIEAFAEDGRVVCV